MLNLSLVLNHVTSILYLTKAKGAVVGPTGDIRAHRQCGLGMRNRCQEPAIDPANAKGAVVGCTGDIPVHNQSRLKDAKSLRIWNELEASKPQRAMSCGSKGANGRQGGSVQCQRMKLRDDAEHQLRPVSDA